MRETKIIVRPRFWLFLMVVFLLVFTPLYLMLNSEGKRLKETSNHLKTQKEELDRQYKELKSELAYVMSDQGLEQLARAAGMIKEGEIQYTAGKIGN